MGALDFLYKTIPGRIVLKPLSSRWLSSLSGFLMDTRASKLLIKSFAKNNGIDTSQYDLSGVKSFNTFFYRPIKEGLRPVCEDKDALVAPCDGLLKVCRIEDDTVISVKQSEFTITELLRSKKLAAKYKDGLCLVFRLCVDNYHRYSYVETGYKSSDRVIPGVYHTVRPVALAERPVFVENSRQYCLIKTPNLGTVVQMEVGAMLVGKICNDHSDPCDVKRGEEKGHFEYGGSTIIVLLRKDAAEINKDIINASLEDEETPVKLGERIGTSRFGI